MNAMRMDAPGLPQGKSRLAPLPRAAAAILPVLVAAVAGSLATTPEIPGWYAGLIKPGFTPPNWVFGPAWTLLYCLMAYAVWRVLSLPGETPGRGAALKAFWVQLALNGLWSFAFFAAHSPAAGLAVIAALWLAIAATIRLFWPLDRIAGALLLPYIAWVSYASALNLAIWRLN